MFNVTVSAHVALLAYAAYCGDAVANWNCFWCSRVNTFSPIGTFGNSSGAAFGFVGIDRFAASPEIVVMWRGTDNIAGWIDDAQFAQIANPFGSGLVHKGFAAAYGAARSDALQTLRLAMSACPHCKRITVSGHSLGAALATLCAADLGGVIVGPTIRLLNFGSPRVGDPAFVLWWASNRSDVAVERHVWEDDIVPHAPAQSFFGTHYAHLPTEVWHPDGGNWQTCSSTNGESPTCADSVPFFFWNWIDHGDYFGVSIFKGIPAGCLFTDH